MTNEILKLIFAGLGIIISGLCSWLVVVLTGLLNSKIKDKKLAKITTALTTIILNSVQQVFQTYVDTLKKEGKFDKEAQKEAINKAKAEGTEMPYHFVEVMSCPGGCIAGGGQPRVMGATFDKPWGINDEIRKLRSKGLNTEDADAKNRLSHKNKSIQKLYKDYLGEAGGHKAHHLLHTKYQKRPLYKI